jgi:predicted acyltransferase
MLVLVCLEIVLTLMRDWCTVFLSNVPLARKSFWTRSVVLLGDELKWMLVLVCLDIVLTLTQDRCTVYVERTIGLKIILDAPNGTPR